MPVDYKKYPPNWKSEIRPAILKRACNRCEFCNVANYAVVRWDKANKSWEFACGSLYLDEVGSNGAKSYAEAKSIADHWNDCCDDKGWIVIVLTIAHLDHDAENENVSHDRLAALCQRCHNNYDKEYRKMNRQKNKGAQSLF